MVCLLVGMCPNWGTRQMVEKAASEKATFCFRLFGMAMISLVSIDQTKERQEF